MIYRETPKRPGMIKGRRILRKIADSEEPHVLAVSSRLAGMCLRIGHIMRKTAGIMRSPSNAIMLVME
jgi:hypothetical protein